MTTIDSSPDVIADTGGASGTLAGLTEWVTSSDHKRIGRLLIGASLLVMLAVTAVGVLLGIERVDGGELVFRTDLVGQLFQAQRVGLVFGAMLPLGLGLAVAVVPLQLGARSLAFPRAALAGVHGWFAGLVLTVVAIANEAGTTAGGVDMTVLFLLGHALMALGLLLVAGTLATSVLTTRAPGMTMRRVPFFAWSALVTGIGLVLALPVAIAAIVYLVVDLRYGATTFGGGEGLGVWFGWPFTAPLTFVFALPAIGVFAEVVPITFQAVQRARGIVFAGLALVVVAALAAVTQQVQFAVPWTGELADDIEFILPFAIFHGLPLLGAVIVLALGLLTAASGKVRITAPFLFAFFGLGMVLVGMLGAALYPIDDLELQGTVFAEGTLVYVAYGSVLGVVGGVLHWAPKLWGRRVPDLKALPLALLGVVATILASLPYYIAGVADQPAASSLFSYSGPESLWNVLVLVGHGLMLLTLLGAIGLLVTTFTGAGEPAGDDPWDGHTIEWSAPSPAPANNYADVPTVSSPEPMLDLRAGSSGSSDGSSS
ncbi:MAG: cbb3-type cytochrome c oxidase subunit I [Ilumatobacteraceae bacterium]